MKKMITFIFVLVLSPAFGWDATGHRLIAQIAYDNLNSSAKSQVDRLTQLLDQNYPPPQRFLFASTWADQIKNDDVTAFNSWHFINYPFSTDGTPLKPPYYENVVWAINQSEQVLQSPHANPYEKAVFLRFLIHFVGDAHQPLHCAERYSRQFPQGDESGNLFPVKDSYVQNLHADWDEGLGLFRGSSKKYPLTNKKVGLLAIRIEQKYPSSFFGNQVDDLNSTDWVQQSFKIATSFAYNNIEQNSALSPAYIEQGQTIVAQQIALAGYRLANSLNQVFK